MKKKLKISQKTKFEKIQKKNEEIPRVNVETPNKMKKSKKVDKSEKRKTRVFASGFMNTHHFYGHEKKHFGVHLGKMKK